MPSLDLIYEKDCPNAALARANLRKALEVIGWTQRWNEHVIGDARAPERVRGYGSPTILVDGTDVAGASHAGEASCRLYASRDGHVGAPAVAQIVAALRNRLTPGPRGPSLPKWCAAGCAVPAVGTALLPALGCPACWPAYAGLLSSLGLGFLADTRWLLAVTGAALLVSLGALAFRSSGRHGSGPFLVGLVAALVILVGKFLAGSNSLLYGGVVGLTAASVWNAWPKRVRTRRSQDPMASPLQKGRDES
jgi:mercuric ion transport protein